MIKIFGDKILNDVKRYKNRYESNTVNYLGFECSNVVTKYIVCASQQVGGQMICFYSLVIVKSGQDLNISNRAPIKVVSEVK